MSMPAFARRIIELEKKVEIFEAYRYSRIGGIVDVTAPDLPLENCMWADGSLALFDLWPELKVKYEKGGFSGLLLPYNCSDEDKKAYPLKWVPDSANPTGLFVPRLNGLFARYCADTNAGAYHRDEIRNIVGVHIASYGVTQNYSSGAFSAANPRASSMQGNAVANGAWDVSFDASRVVPTGPENVPAHYKQPVALYLGRAAKV